MITVGDICEQKEKIRKTASIEIIEDLPFPDTLWEGLLADVPEEYYSCEVVELSISSQALKKWLLKYYVRISDAPKKGDKFVSPECPPDLPFSEDEEVME